MKKISLALLLTSSFLFSSQNAENLSEMFENANVHGNIKYYFIETKKDINGASSPSAHSNSVGGQLSFDTASYNGITTGVTFMTTNPFALPNNVDTSTIGKDNGARGDDAEDSFTVLGEAYVSYAYEDLLFTYGRKAIKTPLIHSKDVRMLPSTVQGAFIGYEISKKSKFELAYLDKFKQRTSDKFTNIIRHALGDETREITGDDEGTVAMLGLDYKEDTYSVKFYDYYADDFINSMYLDASISKDISDFRLNIAAQYINQMSIGNADDNLDKVGSATGGKQINVNAFSLKTELAYADSKFIVAYSNVLKGSSEHDSIITPWDGTPLFTNTITSNSLFESIYGSGLKADSFYIGGSQGMKLAYKQKYDSLGFKGFSTSLTYGLVSNSRFDKDQHDYNLVLAYKYAKNFSLALKGIWVENNTAATATGDISQIKLLTQYRVIANYKFRTE